MGCRRNFVFLAVAFACVLWFGTVVLAQPHLEDAGYTVALENAHLRMWLHPGTTEFVVETLNNGQIWYSNPPTPSRVERVLRGTAQQILSSQFSFDFFLPGDVRMTMNSFSDSVAYGQFEIVPTASGLRIDYEVGKRWQDRDYLPAMVEQHRFEEILESVGAADRRLLERHFTLIGLRPIAPAEERFNIFQVDKERVFSDYTVDSPTGSLTAAARRTQATNLLDTIIGHRSDLEERNDVRLHHMEHLIEQPSYLLAGRLTAWDVEDLIEIFRQHGYTPEDKAADHQANGLDSPMPNIRVFYISVEYSLDGADFIVSVPTDRIQYPKNVRDAQGRLVTIPIHSISLLSYFGAQDPSKDGYIFVPDGSGALIHFHHQRSTTAYEQTIYGRDAAIGPLNDRPRLTRFIHMPVFGLTTLDQGFLAIVEDGEAFAAIRADVPGINNSYSTVGARFTYIPFGQTALQGRTSGPAGASIDRATINIYQSRPYDGSFRIRYRFLPPDATGYVGMSRAYREYLTARHSFSLPEEQEHLPFLLEVVGAIDVQQPVLGLPRTVTRPLTTFDQSLTLVDTLQSLGVANIKLHYVGWLQGGIQQTSLDRVVPESVLGGRADFSRLLNDLAIRGVDLFPQVNFASAPYHGGLFDRNSLRYGARFLNRRVAVLFDYNPATLRRTNSGTRFMVSPSLMPRLAAAFATNYSSYRLHGIAFAHLGTSLHSDFREDPQRLVDRQQALAYVQEAVAAFHRQGHQILIDGAHDYLWPYAQYLVNVPLEASSFAILDQRVPFIQLVLSGLVNYAHEPLNFAPNLRQEFLAALETGALPYFRWTYSPGADTKDTPYAWLFATHYQDWLEETVALYQEMDKVYRAVRGHQLVDHQVIGPGLHKSTFSNGVRIIVNYTPDTVEFRGHSIVGQGYVVIKEGGQQ